jgi:penicillin amidase
MNLPILLLAACTSGRDPKEKSDLLGVEVTETWSVRGLKAPATVVRTEMNVPHIYASDREDLSRVYGFVMARDRYFEIDLARRLGLGQVSELFGEAGLGSDLQSRQNGTTYVADLILRNLDASQQVQFDAFAAGINDYLDAVEAGALPPPSELKLAAPLLGAGSPLELMKRFERRDVAGVAAAIVYNLGYETGDIGNAVTQSRIPTTYADGTALGDLRSEGLWDDVWLRIEPVYPTSSAHGWQTETAERQRRSRVPRLPTSLEQRVQKHAAKFEKRLGHEHVMGFGSNAWAVGASKTTDGRALVAGDGHLSLAVPSLFYQIGLDDSVFGGGDTHQMGLTIPGMPLMAVGTNGKVGWSQTQLMGDITDWYREEIQLDATGAPTASLFEDAWQPLTRVDESFTIAEIALLDSVGRDETWGRWTTFDGRWITDIEGRATTADEVLPDGQIKVNLQGDLVVPMDTDGDGKITAISFDFTGLDEANLLGAVDGFGHANDVREFQEATKGLVAYSQNVAVADSSGSVLYTGYQTVPCRGYLARNGDGTWGEGSDPSLLLDGNRYGGFTIPTVNGKVDESQSADPYSCVVPFDVYPQARNPAQGYVLTANNDVGEISIDGSLTNDPWYIGGPWGEGYRAHRIDTRLAEVTADNSADIAAMASIQGDTKSGAGEHLTPILLGAIEHARAANEAEGELSAADARLAELYAAHQAEADEVYDRLTAWKAADYATPSGVTTFYHTPAPGDDASSVATTIFNAWLGPFQSRIWDDEGWPDVFQPTGGTGRMRTMLRLLRGRGADNPEGLKSWNPDTQESAFFDRLGTPEVETSDELALLALGDALTFLASPGSKGEGGYGTEDMSTWLWGLRHYVRFDSQLEDYLGSDPMFAPIMAQFAITPERLPLADSVPSTDPRYGMKGFPRPGDNFSVDAANSGMNGRSFSHGSGPVFRMVISLGADGASGQNILPQGQSGLNDSPYFDDQAKLWLANDAIPMRIDPSDVAANAIGREEFLPAEPWY